MKFKLKEKRGTGVLSLVVEGGKGDEIDYVEAERVRTGGVASFVPLSYEKKGKVYQVIYQVRGLVSLGEMLKVPLEPQQFRVLLASFLRLVLDCEESRLMRQRVAFDPDKILYDRAGWALRFVYVPLQSFVSSTTDMNAALVYVCEHALVRPGDLELRAAVLDYARRTAIVTGIEFASFLRERGVTPPDNMVSASDFGSGSGQPSVPTDQLDSRTKHGLDFVSAQNRQVRQGSGDAGPGERSGCTFVRVSTGASWVLAEGSFVVGRASECELILDDVKGLSRRHAALTVSGGRCFVRDLGSTNGVLVNGLRIPASVDAPVRQGDRLTLGNEDFEVRQGG